MELAVVKDAVQQLEGRGVLISEITSPMIREITGYGSYTSITEHLRTIRGEVPASSEAPENGSPTCKETALALFDDTPVDLVQAAEGALQRAKERLQEAEIRVPELERQLAGIREDMHRATLRHMTLAFEVGRGMLSDTDPELKASEADMWQAHRRHRQAAEELARAPQLIQSARGAVRIATQQVWLAREHPELVQALTEAEGHRPTEDRGPDSYREWAIWRQEVSSARSACDAAVCEAGV
jgi:hypothetical protein